jgi:hypothetical protein
MERTEDLIRALLESFHAHARPCKLDTARGRAWLQASHAIELVASESFADLTEPLRATVRACRVLGVVEPVAYAAALGGALRLDLGPVFVDSDCDCAA